MATICHRALVFNRGEIVSRLEGIHLTTEALVQAASAGEIAGRDRLARSAFPAASPFVRHTARRRSVPPMNSIESDALEPTRDELADASLGQRLVRLAPVHGLVILTVLLIVLFSVLLPETFPTMPNLRSIVSDKAIIAILSLAAMIPMVAGKIDLTVGYGIVLWHILAISLQTMGLPWPVACLVVLALGAFSGFLNGLLVEVAKIDAFIATLGTGTVLYAIALNVWGTLIGVTILAVGISGIQQFGGSFRVEPLFDGVTLLVAIGIADYARRRRGGAAPVRPAIATAPPGLPGLPGLPGDGRSE